MTKKKIPKMADGFRYIRELIDALTDDDPEKVPPRFASHADVIQAMEDLFEESKKNLDSISTRLDDLASDIQSDAGDIEIDDDLQMDSLYDEVEETK